MTTTYNTASNAGSAGSKLEIRIDVFSVQEVISLDFIKSILTGAGAPHGPNSSDISVSSQSSHRVIKDITVKGRKSAKGEGVKLSNLRVLFKKEKEPEMTVRVLLTAVPPEKATLQSTRTDAIVFLFDINEECLEGVLALKKELTESLGHMFYGNMPLLFLVGNRYDENEDEKTALKREQFHQKLSEEHKMKKYYEVCLSTGQDILQCVSDIASLVMRHDEPTAEIIC